MKHCSFESPINERWHTISWGTYKECIMKVDHALSDRFKTVVNVP